MDERHSVTLEAFDERHFALFEAWLAQPEVARWWTNAEADLAFARQPPDGATHRLITLDGAAVGYLRWRVVGREDLDAAGLDDIPTDSVDIDIFIGEESARGCGAGPAALEVLVAHLQLDPTLPMAGLTTSVDNIRAHRAFEKAGFENIRTYHPQGHGECCLYVRRLDASRPPTGSPA